MEVKADRVETRELEGWATDNLFNIRTAKIYRMTRFRSEKKE